MWYRFYSSRNTDLCALRPLHSHTKTHMGGYGGFWVLWGLMSELIWTDSLEAIRKAVQAFFPWDHAPSEVVFQEEMLGVNSVYVSLSASRSSPPRNKQLLWLRENSWSQSKPGCSAEPSNAFLGWSGGSQVLANPWSLMENSPCCGDLAAKLLGVLEPNFVPVLLVITALLGHSCCYYSVSVSIL